jgi:hypothetical protein
MKAEVRVPKAERRPKPEGRMAPHCNDTRDRLSSPVKAVLLVLGGHDEDAAVFRISDFGLLSAFGFRPSDLGFAI